MRRILFTTVVLMFMATAVEGSSPRTSAKSCDGANLTQGELTDFAGSQYRKSDAHLNKVYRLALQHMAEELAQAQRDADNQQVGWAQTGIESLKQAERAWLSYRDLQCKAAGKREEGGSITPMIISNCLKTLTEHRIVEIKSIYEDGNRKLH